MRHLKKLIRVCVVLLILGSPWLLPAKAPAADGSRETARLQAPGNSTGKTPETGELPVLEITTDSGLEPGDADTLGLLRFTDAGLPERDVVTPAAIRLRGNTSRRYPKKSFRVSLKDENGKKRKLSLAGLREDDDWILNPMYSDSSKIREALAYWLWEEINSCGQAAAGSRLAFAEVFINGDYRGLYALQERMDRKQVGADRKAGILYKVDTNRKPTAGQLREKVGAETCEGLELTFAGSEVQSPWLPAADYLAFLEGEEGSSADCLSEENTIDYGLWAVLTQAKDCHYKNQFLHAVPQEAGYTLYRIPWDLNHTFGDLWSGTSEETNFLDYRMDFPAEDDVLALRLASGEPEFRRKLRDRWQDLREGAVTEENILNRAEALHRELYPAILRDQERWPESGMGEGNAANIRDIRDFIHSNLIRMDRWVRDLAEETEEQ